jgi:hypothetical protein
MADESEKKSKSVTINTQRSWIYGVGAVLILILVFMAGMGAAAHHEEMKGKRGIFTVQRGEFGTHMGGSPMGAGIRHELGSSTTSNGETRLSGVVTAVNGSSFTVAGSGATNNVTTNSSTQYQSGNQVKVNDTLLVTGTSSNGTLTATHIVINP